MLKNKSTDFMAKSALIAAIYLILTVMPPFNAIGFGIIQFRISEALMILCVTTPASIIGVSIGCLLSNIFVSGNPFDIFFGTFATVIAAITTWRFREIFNKFNFLAPIPTIVFNTVIVGLYLPFLIADISLLQLFQGITNPDAYMIIKNTSGFLTSMSGVFVGETLVCYLIGIPLMRVLKKMKIN